VVATVNGKEVTAGDVVKMLENSPPEFGALFRQDPKSAIQQFFLMGDLSREGEKRKLAERNPLKEKLEAVRSYMIATEVVNTERNSFQVSNEAMDSFYANNKARYSQAKIKVIAIRFLPNPPSGTSPEAVKEQAKIAFLKSQNPNLRTEDEGVKLANDIVKKLRAGADFTAMVKQYSEEPETKELDGDFGLVKYTSAYPDAFKKAALALAKPGDISEPARVDLTLYIIRMEEKTVQPLDEVREPIIQELRNQHFQDWLNGLMRKYELTIKNYDFFARPGQAAPAKPLDPPKVNPVNPPAAPARP
jgi:parvulin-like peptidyl-prolyl isomerase